MLTGRDLAEFLAVMGALLAALAMIMGFIVLTMAILDVDAVGPRQRPVTVTVHEDPQGGIVCRPTGVCRVAP